MRSAIALVVLLVMGLLCAATLRGCANLHSRPGGHGDVSFALTPSGDALVFNGQGQGVWDLYRLDLGTKRVARITETDDYETAPSVAPDGRSIVYAAGIPGDRADHLFIRPLDGSPARQVTQGGSNDSAPEFSPDGSMIVFIRDNTYNWGGKASNWDGGVVCLVRADGSGLREITGEGLSAWDAHFSPDGRTILFGANDGIFTVAADGSTPPRRLQLGGRQPVYAPDGQSIAFVMGQYAGDSAIYVLRRDGSGLRKVFHMLGGCFRPIFKRDGSGFSFLNESWPAGPGGFPKFSLWEVGLDGLNPKPLADVGLIDAPMEWKP